MIIDVFQIPSVVPALCMVYFSPLDRMTRCTSAISFDTEADAVPILNRINVAMIVKGLYSQE